jgi:hypothetical protein
MSFTGNTPSFISALIANIEIDSDVQYFGDKDTDGSYRVIRDSGYLKVELRTGGIWVLQFNFDPATNTLDNLSDVDTTYPTLNNDVLSFDSGLNVWKPRTLDIPSLDDISNVNAGAPDDGDVLTYDTGAGEWIAQAPSGGGGGSSLDILNDYSTPLNVSIENPLPVSNADNKYVYFNTPNADSESFAKQGSLLVIYANNATFGNGIYLITSLSETRSFTSTDAINWTVSALPAAFNGVAFGNGVFVAFANTVPYTSTDGINWTVRTNATTVSPIECVYHNGLFVAVGSSSTASIKVVTSPDGITWTGRTTPNFSFRSIASSGTTLVATFDDTTTLQNIATSPDGITWTTRTGADFENLAVTFGNGIFVAAGFGLSTSTDGITWTRTFSSYAVARGLTFGNGIFVASVNGVSTTSMQSILTSTDGVHWKEFNLDYGDNRPPAVFIQTLQPSRQIRFANGLFFASPDKAGGIIYKSTDAVNWSVAYGFNYDIDYSPSLVPHNPFCSIYAGGKYVSMSAYSVVNDVAVSSDGINWSSASTGFNNQWKSIAYGAGVYVAVSNVGQKIAYSPNGINWTAASFSNSNYWNSVTYGAGVFVVVGGGSSNDLVMTSTDGITWTNRSVPTSRTYTSIIFGNGTFLALSPTPVSGLGSAMTSTDGITWTNINLGSPRSLYSYTNAKYVNGFFYLMNQVYPNNNVLRLIRSPDLVTWTSCNPAQTGMRVNDIEFGNGVYIVVAFSPNSVTQRVLSSTDGITFNATSYGLNQLWVKNIIFDGSNFLMPATRGGGLYADNIGSIVVTSTGSSFSYRYTAGEYFASDAVEFNGKYYVVCGSSPSSNSSILVSDDGINWTVVNPSVNSEWKGIATNGEILVVVGSSGTNRVMTSPDGITWTGRVASSASAWKAVTFGNGLFVAIAETATTNIMTSPDGITWTARTSGEGSAGGLSSITFGNGVFVAAPINTRLYTSLDGITWTLRTLSAAGVVRSVSYIEHLNTYLAATGSISFYESTNGTTWTTRSNALPQSVYEFIGIKSRRVLLGVGFNSIIHSLVQSYVFASLAWIQNNTDYEVIPNNCYFSDSKQQLVTLSLQRDAVIKTKRFSNVEIEDGNTEGQEYTLINTYKTNVSNLYRPVFTRESNSKYESYESKVFLAGDSLKVRWDDINKEWRIID